MLVHARAHTRGPQSICQAPTQQVLPMQGRKCIQAVTMVQNVLPLLDKDLHCIRLGRMLDQHNQPTVVGRGSSIKLQQHFAIRPFYLLRCPQGQDPHAAKGVEGAKPCTAFSEAASSIAVTRMQSKPIRQQAGPSKHTCRCQARPHLPRCSDHSTMHPPALMPSAQIRRKATDR